MSDLISRQALLEAFASVGSSGAPSYVTKNYIQSVITNAPAIEQGEAVYQEYNPLISYWMDCDKDTYDKATERRVLYTTPQQPQSVADALEEAAKICNDMSIKYGIAMSKANQRSSDGVYDQRKGGREASLLCGEKILTLIKRNEKEGE